MLRGTLHDIILKNLYGIKNLNKNKFNFYIDQFTKYKWSTARKARYAGLIMGVGVGMSAIKVFAGVKSVDLIGRIGKEIQESEVLDEATKRAQEFGKDLNRTFKTVKEEVGESARKVTEVVKGFLDKVTNYFRKNQITTQEGNSVLQDIPQTSAETETSSLVSTDTSQDINIVENIFQEFEKQGEPLWNTGVSVGESLAKEIDTESLDNIWMHGDIKVYLIGAYKNFFGHLASEGPISKRDALKIAEHLKEALRLDQKDYKTMAHLVATLKKAVDAKDLQETLNSMSKNDALNAVYFSYAEGLIKNEELRKVLVDFIKQNTR